MVEPFADNLARRGLVLERGRTTALQVNLGLLCGSSCRHCHLEAGPHRREMMNHETVQQVIDFAGRYRFACIDITGGAPEMNPHLNFLLQQLRPLAPRLMLRATLINLARDRREELLELCRRNRVVIITSLPATNAAQTDGLRGEGVMEESLAMLGILNRAGYGRPGTGLELNLVSNPAGAFLPAAQCQLEKKFRHDLERRWGIVFTRLFTFANVPLGRFRNWLEKSGNLREYMERLAADFNPSAIGSLMCRSQLSVSWDGYLYDCDFNLAAGLVLGDCRRHISEVSELPPPGTVIATGDYCYACTAGSGFT